MELNWVILRLWFMGYTYAVVHVTEESWVHNNSGLFLLFQVHSSKQMRRLESRKSHSWWWDSHISPKNSKWLSENLEGMQLQWSYSVYMFVFVLYLSSFFNSSVFTFQVLLFKRLYCCSDTCNPWVKILLIWSFFAATDSLTSSVFHFYFFSLDYLHFFRLPKLNSLFVCGKA